MTCSAWARWGWHRISGGDDAAQVDPVQQQGKSEYFVALRGNPTLGDHDLAGVERGGKQVRSVGIGSKAGDGGQRHGSAQDGDQA
ncbi:hypothetical protein ACFXGR_41075 [Streptomyces mirabilis]|uniref:hypothetical protein n=1 Tax=Streptomyces mirabilis TaxID=68239 RepID=UPI003678C553